ncbi:hypothetical protein BH11PSE3_BH11PSE3_05330 [soil metagenome]
MSKAPRLAESPAVPSQTPGDTVGIQVPVGRIATGNAHWQVVFEARAKPCIYRLHNGSPGNSRRAGASMIVEADGAGRILTVHAGASVDVLAKRIRVKAANPATTVEGWYVLVS